MADNIEPTTHLEKVIAGQESPITHLEQVIALYGGTGGSGGSGTTNYNALLNKPSINGVDLIGNKTLSDLGITNYDDTQVKTDISDLDTNKQDKTDNSLDTTDKTITGAINEINDSLLDNVTFSSDYKNIIINRKGGSNPYTIPIASIIHNAKLIELNDIDSTNIGDGKTLVYDGTTKKHKYVSSTGTDELVKMDSTTDAKHLSELIDKSTVVNDNGVLKVKKLDGQQVTIAEINHLKGLTMNVMDLVNTFANGGVKIINTPVATHADLLAYDKTGLIDGISYLVYVLADETHDNAKTTYLIDKTSSTPTYFGFAGEHRDFTTSPINLANEVTGKLGASHIDVDALWKLLTINDTYKTLTTKDEVFGTHGAKALYDELVTSISKKANATDLTTHTNDTDIHITTAERTAWNKVDNKVDKTDIIDNLTSTNTDKPLSANQGKVLNDKIGLKANDNEVVKKTDITTTIDSTSTNSQVPTAKSVYNLAGNENRRGYIFNNPTYRGDTWNRVFRVNSLLSCDSGFLTVTVYSNGLCQIATFLMSKNFNRLNIKQINCGGYNGDKGQSRPIKVRIVSAETIGYSFLEIYVSGTSNTNVAATYMPLSCNSVVVLNEKGSIPSGMFACEMTATHDTYENATYTSVLK